MRDKEEELEGSLQKMDALRNDLRRAEKLRRDLEARAEELMADVVREKRLRERAEENVRLLHDDIERLQQKAAAGEAALNSLELNQEVTRLFYWFIVYSLLLSYGFVCLTWFNGIEIPG